MLLGNKKGSAILIALVVLIILTIMSTVFIEKLLSFSKASEGIENSNVAYYNALGIIEESLYTGGVNKYTPWMITNQSSWNPTSTGKSISVLTGGLNIPIVGNGNSSYDSNWNIITMGDPVQLVIPSGMNPINGMYFSFRIPKIESTQTSTGLSIPLNSSGIIMWTFTSTGNSLYASGEANVFLGTDINIETVLDLKMGVTNTGVYMSYRNFYGAYGSACGNYKCTLKLSMLRPVSTDDNPNVKIPFLEYKIRLPITSPPLPQKFMKIEARGYAYGFMRSRTIELPQITTNNALDFAVLQ